MKAVIIEDEHMAAIALQELIREIDPGIEILAILQSIEESIEWFQEHAMPDILFMDIHLADGSSFSIFDEVTISCPIIFTTAYDEYALKAFEVNSIDYLLKPIHKKELDRAIAKYKNLSKNTLDQELINNLIINIKQTSSTYKSNFLVPERDKLIPLATKDIAYIYIDTKMVKVVTFDQKSHYMEQTLDELMHQLDPRYFFRANRQFIIALAAVKDASIWFGNKLSINLTVPPPERVIVSKAKVKEFKKWIVGA